MKRSLSHLPLHKRRELQAITDRPDISGSKPLWSLVERKIRRAAVSKTWTTLIIHDIAYVNRRIAKAQFNGSGRSRR